MSTMDTVIIGAGIAGLTVAWRLTQAGQRAVVLEASDHVGGVIRTLRADDCVKECGPNAFLGDAEALLELARSVGLADAIVDTPPSAADRFIYWNGRLHPVPRGPRSLLTTRLLSWRGKCRILGEWWVPANGHANESVAEFVRRRLGPEAVERLINPLVAGIFAGDAAQLSLAAAFPKMAALEKNHGGLLRGALSIRRGIGARTVRGFRDGMGILPAAIARQLGGAIRTRTPVTQIQRNADGSFLVTSDVTSHVAHRVICATPAPVAAELLRDLIPTAVAPLRAIPYAPIVVVHAAYAARALPRPLSGFGFLVPSHTPVHCLGTLWTSNCFADRAPAGTFLCTMFYGGMRAPQLLAAPDATITAHVAADARATMGIATAPLHIQITRHRAAIPQYTLGHLDRVRQIAHAVATTPGLHLTGNYLTGTSVNDTIANANQIPTC